MKTLRMIKAAAAPMLAAAMVMSAAAAGPAESYFTTYVSAQGYETVHLHNSNVIPHEDVDANVKNISVQNTGEDECYVRVRVVSSDQVPVAYAGAGWTDGGDGYWYYDDVLAPNAITGVLAATITLPTSSTEKPIPESTTVNVVVVTECAKVLYDDDGEARPNGPAYMGWTLTAKEG